MQSGIQRGQILVAKRLLGNYSSFANTAGGYILLGIRENPWEISGVKNPEKILKDLCNTANNKSMVNYNLLENRNMQTHELDGKKMASKVSASVPVRKAIKAQSAASASEGEP